MKKTYISPEFRTRTMAVEGSLLRGMSEDGDRWTTKPDRDGDPDDWD